MAKSRLLRKTISRQQLNRDLVSYALTAGATGVSALALAQAASAEVVYTPVDQHINAHQGYAIDLNHDGIVDFRIQNLSRRQRWNGLPYSSNILLQVLPATGVQHGTSYALAGDVRAGGNIGPIEPAQPNHLGGAILATQFRDGSFGTYYWGEWFNVSNRFLGFAFKVNGETHYGWARLSVSWNHRWILSAHLSGYAYETVPDKPIIAGDTGGGEELGTFSSGAMDTLSSPQADRSASLGVLALGAGGLSLWRTREMNALKIGDQ